MRSGHSKWTESEWSKCSNILGGSCIVLLAVGSAIASVFELGLVDQSIWIQYIITWWAMELIVSLTFENSSVVSRVLSSKAALFLGRISYALYLVHMPVHQYLAYIIWTQQNGVALIPSTVQTYTMEEIAEHLDEIMAKTIIPSWAIIPMWICSIIFAILLNRFFEEPLQRRLRPARNSIKSNIAVDNKTENDGSKR